jgi:deoxyadenosine/deoxycytidine kinase
MKKLIWIMGSMSSGKSTLRRNFCNVMYDGKPKVIRGVMNNVPYIITEFGEVCIVGEATETSACDGLDKSFGHLKKDGGINSVIYGIKNYEYTILEGSQTASTWIEELNFIAKEYNVEFYAIYLNVTLWQNYKRLLNRIQERGKTEADMTDKRLESVRSKNKQFRGVFDKCSVISSIKSFELAVDDATEEQTLLGLLKILDLV